MREKESMMQKAFKHLAAIIFGIGIICMLIILGVTYAVTKSIGAAILLVCIMIVTSTIMVMGAIIPIRVFLKHYGGTIEDIQNGNLNLVEQLGQMQSNKTVNKITKAIESILGEFVDLVDSSFVMMHTITTSTKEVNKHSDDAIASIEQMSNMMQEIAEGATKQAAQSQTGQALMETLSEEITSAYDNCQGIMNETDKMTTLNKEGQQSIAALKVKAADGVAATKQIDDNIKGLTSKMKDIASFVETIESIASQTNLLALNAAIEAARAGEAGRGFGVVAEEIRKLADQSQETTNEIRNLVSGIEDETKVVYDAMKKMNEVSQEEDQAVASAEMSFGKIAISIDEIANSIQKTNEMISKVNEDKIHVNKIIEDVSLVSQQTAAHTQEGASSAEEQAALMQQVKTEIAHLSNTVDQLNTRLDKYSKFSKIRNKMQ